MSDPSDKGAIIMLAGPIKHWWGENWDSAEHWHYAAWRDAVNDGLVDSGYLVYRPHEAFKGQWTERAQSVNDLVLRMADVILNLTPPGVPSQGTDGEMLYAQTNGSAEILSAPPPKNFERGVKGILKRLDDLKIARAMVDQEIVVESLGLRPDRLWMFRGAIEHFTGQVLRLHFEDWHQGIDTVDAHHVILPENEDIVAITSTTNTEHIVPFSRMKKLEVLARAA